MLSISLRRHSERGLVTCQTQCRPDIKEKPKSAGLLTAGNSSSLFFPPLPARTGVFKRPENRPPKMDMFVPSPGLSSAQYAISPHSSIYDHDKVDLNMMCEGAAPLSNPGMDSVNVDDFCNLDESFENSTLKSFLTADVLTSLAGAGEAISSGFPWAAKSEKIAANTCCADNVSHNPTLAELNMDEFSVEGIFNLDQEASKLSESSFGMFNNVANPSGYSRSASEIQSTLPSPSSASESSSSAVVSSQDHVGRPVTESSETLSSLGNSYMRNMSPMRSINTFFPPRQTNPPVVGVVAPVQQPVMVQTSFTPDFIKQEPKSTTKQPSHLLQELLCKKSSSAVTKVEPGSGPDRSCEEKNFSMVSYSGVDMQPQIVPNSALRKRDAEGNLKSQSCTPATVVKEESTEERWEDIESFINETKQEQLVKRRRCDSGSSGHMSNDEEDEDDDDGGSSLYGGNNGGDDSDDDMSDIDADLTHIRPGEQESLIPNTANVVGGKKQQKQIQYFWQYNVQAKGPKGTRLKLAVESPADPHILNDFEDPVFDECNTSIAGIRHGGKARKGDGNEITPNPRKLYLIGLQLARLNRQINACCQQISGPAGANGVSAAQRNASRKEKNKLASRACRLKKKAQHEANKIKLHGLAQEHRQLNSVSSSVWAQLKERVKAILSTPGQVQQAQSSLTSLYGPQIDQALEKPDNQVSGHSVDYVNSVILKVEAGDSDGGLNILRRRQQQKS